MDAVEDSDQNLHLAPLDMSAFAYICNNLITCIVSTHCHRISLCKTLLISNIKRIFTEILEINIPFYVVHEDL